MDEFASVCEQAAKSGGNVLLELWGRVNPAEKGRHDLVTEADLNSQKVIADILQASFPDHSIVGEEDLDTAADHAGPVRYTWLIDPLDGTTNYIHGFPHVCVSVALVEHADNFSNVIAATVFDPCRGESFTASAGRGSFLNGVALRVSDATALDQSLLAESLPPAVERDSVEVQTMVRAMIAARSVRRTGSAALNLAYLAAARLDGYWATTLNAWDVAAGALLVQEAGGVITDFWGGPLDVFAPNFVAAATPELYAELAALVRKDANHKGKSSS